MSFYSGLNLEQSTSLNSYLLSVNNSVYRRLISFFGFISLSSFFLTLFSESSLLRLSLFFVGVFSVVVSISCFVMWQKRISFFLNIFYRESSRFSTNSLGFFDTEGVDYDPSKGAVCFSSFKEGESKGWLLGKSAAKYNGVILPGSVFYKDKEFHLYGIFERYPPPNSVKFGDIRYDFKSSEAN